MRSCRSVSRTWPPAEVRSVPWDGVWERATPLTGFSALQVPALEDHALLVIQHLAASDFVL